MKYLSIDLHPLLTYPPSKRSITIFWIIFLTLLINSCDYRTPSKDRFEKITGIELSDSIKVLNDSFTEMGPDYSLSYKLTLSQNECENVIIKIQERNNWNLQHDEWEFNKTANNTYYNITFSIENCQLSYLEYVL